MENTNELKEKQSEINNEPHRNKYLPVIAIALSAVIGALAGVLIAVNRNSGESEMTEKAVTESVQPIDNESDTVSEEFTKYVIPQPSEINDLIDIIAEARNKGMVKRCYLTFDDGPSSNVTGEILDILADYNIKATFFEVGKSIRAYPNVTRRVYSEGHLLANHSYNHEYSSLYESEDAFMAEIKTCEMELEAVIGEQVSFKLVRFPGGSYNAGTYGEKKQMYKQTLGKMGYYYCDWNVLNGDAEGEKKDAEGLIEFFKSSAQRYIEENKNLIVLMHDTDAKKTTAQSLEKIIIYLKECGYTFHRLDDIEL